MKRFLDLCALIAVLALAPPAAHASNDFDVCRRYDLQQLARQGTPGSPEAEFCLGFGYAAGQVLSRDLPKAMTHYRTAAQKGYAPAEAALGLHYQQGLGVAPDLDQAIAWYRKAAAHGHEGAKQNLQQIEASARNRKAEPPLPGQKLFDECTRLYKAGDKAGAVKPCMAAAQAGNHWAQLQIGYQYEFAEGLPQNFGEAVKWYAKSANQGNSAAQRNLGQMYEDGAGVREDWVMAAQWYRKSADQGYAKGQSSLGRCYEFGIGVPQSRGQAIAWFNKAAQGGDGKAAYFARHLGGNNFIGFRTEDEHAMVINGKLRFALAFQEPVGMTFRNSGERNAYLMNLRQQVDRAEASVWWNIKSSEYDSCMRRGGRGCQNPGPRP
jgi:TPR repeat protein